MMFLTLIGSWRLWKVVFLKPC